MLNDEHLKMQEFALRVLDTHRLKNRLATTYLLTGGSTASQEAVAMAFASALAAGPAARMGDMETQTAKRVLERNHPDVLWFGDDEKVRSLKISEVREIIHWSGMKPYESKWKICLMKDAERLTVEAQNALLKTLEEPPAQTIFCLLTENTDNLLDTIRSRSFRIRLAPELPPPAQAPEGLGQKKWEDLLEEYQGAARHETAAFLDQLMAYFRDLIRSDAAQPVASEHRPAWMKAMDLVYETRDALEANANQKLALTRLAMRLKRVFPSAQMLKTPSGT